MSVMSPRARPRRRELGAMTTKRRVQQRRRRTAAADDEVGAEGTTGDADHNKTQMCRRVLALPQPRVQESSRTA